MHYVSSFTVHLYFALYTVSLDVLLTGWYFTPRLHCIMYTFTYDVSWYLVYLPARWSSESWNYMLHSCVHFVSHQALTALQYPLISHKIYTKTLEVNLLILESLCIKTPHRTVYHLWFQNKSELYHQIYIIQIYSGITSSRVFDGELLYTKILEVNFCICLQTVSWRFLFNQSSWNSL